MGENSIANIPAHVSETAPKDFAAMDDLKQRRAQLLELERTLTLDNDSVRDRLRVEQQACVSEAAVVARCVHDLAEVRDAIAREREDKAGLVAELSSPFAGQIELGIPECKFAKLVTSKADTGSSTGCSSSANDDIVQRLGRECHTLESNLVAERAAFAAVTAQDDEMHSRLQAILPRYQAMQGECALIRLWLASGCRSFLAPDGCTVEPTPRKTYSGLGHRAIQEEVHVKCENALAHRDACVRMREALSKNTRNEMAAGSVEVNSSSMFSSTPTPTLKARSVSSSPMSIRSRQNWR